MTKNLIGALFVVGSLASCGAVKTIQNNPLRGQDAKFIDDITFTPSKVISTQATKSNKIAAEKTAPVVAAAKEEENLENVETTTNNTNNSVVVAESATDQAVKAKYASMLGVDAQEITNLNLYRSISNWYGTRYNYGGESHRGVDCSSLMQHLNRETWNRKIPRTARLQHGATPRISKDELQEGDLVFFNTTGGVSHVGMYLKNGKFVHASCSKGVTISSLSENYYAKRYIGAGRFN